MLPVTKDFVDVAFIVDGDEETPRFAVDETVFLAGKSHSRSIHYRHHLLHIFRQESVEKPLVSVLQPKSFIMLARGKFKKTHLEKRSNSLSEESSII